MLSVNTAFPAKKKLERKNYLIDAGFFPPRCQNVARKKLLKNKKNVSYNQVDINRQ